MGFASNRWNARAYGSQAPAYVVASLTQAATGASLDARGALGGAAPSDALVVLFVHDTNQLYLRQLLGLSWFARGWEGNAVSTGGALVFELLEDGGGAHYVRVAYVVASPRQQREAAALSLAAPLAEARLVVPACGARLCPLATFQRVALDALCADCVTEPLQGVVRQLAAELDAGGGGSSCGGGRLRDWQVALVAVGCATFAAALAAAVTFSLMRGPRNARYADAGQVQDPPTFL